MMGVVAGVVGGWWEGRSGGCWLVAVKGQRRVQSGAVVKRMCITREANMRRHSGKRRQNLARHYVGNPGPRFFRALPSFTHLSHAARLF